MNHPPILFREPNAPPKTPPLLLFFSEEAVKNEAASKDGPPLFDVAHVVKVVVAGARGDEGPKYTLWKRRPDGTEKIEEQKAYQRFRLPYEQWKTGQLPANTGTPLEQWPLMDVAMVAALKVAHVYTVQQLSELSDAQCEQVLRRGGREWRAKALAWLDEARTAAGDVEARARIAKLEDELKETKDLLKQALKNQNTQGFDAPKRRSSKAKDDDMAAALSAEQDEPRL